MLINSENKNDFQKEELISAQQSTLKLTYDKQMKLLAQAAST